MATTKRLKKLIHDSHSRSIGIGKQLQVIAVRWARIDGSTPRAGESDVKTKSITLGSLVTRPHAPGTISLVAPKAVRASAATVIPQRDAVVKGRKNVLSSSRDSNCERLDAALTENGVTTAIESNKEGTNAVVALRQSVKEVPLRM